MYICKLQDDRKDAHCNSDDQTLYKVVQLILPMLKCCNWNFWSIHILKFWRPPFSKWLTTWSSQYNVGQLQVISDFCAKFEWQSVPLKCRQTKKTLQRFCRSYIMNETCTSIFWSFWDINQKLHRIICSIFINGSHDFHFTKPNYINHSP